MSGTCAVVDTEISSDCRPFSAIIRSEGEGMRKFKEVIGETRRIALTHPLNRNADSEYFNADGSPCCIFGHALDALGIAFDHDLSIEAYGSSIGELPWDLLGFEEPNDYQALWAVNVQTAADNGQAWIVAVATADATPV